VSEPGPSADAPATAAAATVLHPHRFTIALLHPQIAANTGNIARLCVASGTALHLVRPMGFVLDDRQLRRSAMDYWPRLRLTVHDDDSAFFAAVHSNRCWFFSSKATRTLWQANYADGDVLVFGSETAGLPAALLQRHAHRAIRIPQVKGERCLNLSTAVGIGLYEAIRTANMGTPP
jgi:tRNA (cytidine/uridine-2'-O-)-methyltransferase